MKIMTYNGDREYYIRLLNFLKDMKIAYGPKKVSDYLRKHRGIDRYLLDHMRSDAKQLDSDLLLLD